MNKLFTKIGTAMVGIAMAIGVGVAVGREGFEKAEAATTVTLSSGNFADGKITWTESNFIVEQLKGNSSTNVNSSYISGPRLYKGHILHFGANDGYAITSITIDYNGSYKGNSMTAGIAVSNNVVTDNSTAVSRTWDTEDGGSHLVSSASDDGLSDIYIQNVASGSNIQLRPTKISVEYKSTAAPENPMTANPVLELSNTSVEVGKTITLSATYTPSTPDENITCTSSDPKKLSVSGEGSPWVLTGLDTAASVTVTVAGAYSKKSSSVTVTVIAAIQSSDDKALVPAKLGLSGTSYTDGNDGNHQHDAVTYTTLNVAEKTAAFQFRANSKGNGNFFNVDAFSINSSNVDIKAITLYMSSEDLNTQSNTDIHVYEGTSSEPTSEVLVDGGTVSATGINYYPFTSGKSFFRIATTGSNGAIFVDYIVIELANSASASLTKARNAAGHILSAFDGKCGTGGTGVVTSAEWSSLQATVASDLGDDSVAKSILKNATRIRNDNLKFDGSTIENAMYRYDYVANKFGFSVDESISAVSSVRNVAPYENDNLAHYSTVLIIVIISSVTLVTIIGCAVLHRRKEQQ